MATSLGRLVLDMAANSAGFERDMQRISKSSQKELNKVSRQLRFAQRDLDQARAKVTRLAGAMTALGGIALGATVREFRRLSQEADRIQKLGIATGLTAEAIQELGFAAEQSGSNLEGLVKGVQQMQKNIVQARDGLATYTRAFERVGISVKDLDGLNAEEQFLMLAQAISEVEDPTERTATAMELLGRAGKDLIPLLNQGSAGVEQLQEQMRATGAVMSQEAVDATAQFNDAMNVLTKQLGAFRNQLFADVIEPLSVYAQWLANTEQGQEAFASAIESIIDTAKILGTIVGVGLVAAFTKAVAAMIAAEIRVASLTRQKMVLAGATRSAATAVTLFSRAVSVATGPIGIAVAAIGTIAIAAGRAREHVGQFEQSIHDLRLEMRAFASEQQAREAIEHYSALADGAEAEIERIEQAMQRLRENVASGNLPPGASESGTESLFDDFEQRLENARAQLEEFREKESQAREEMEKLGGASTVAGDGIEGMGDDADDAADKLENLQKQQASFVNSIEDIEARLAGDVAVAMLDYRRSIEDANRLYAEGVITLGQYMRALDAFSGKLKQSTGGEGMFPDFGVLDTALEGMTSIREEMEKAAAIEWDFENFIDSFHPLAGMMRQLGDEIELVNARIESGQMNEMSGMFMKAGASANAAFSAMMAGVDQTSSEYKKLERAQQITNVALGIAAILQQGMGDPYTAIPRMVAMAAMVASLGVDTGGISGGSASQRRQDTQGTGTVLGDSEAKSESIANAVDITADATSKLVGINRGMLHALRALQEGLSGAAGMVARGAGQFDASGINLGMSGLESAFKTFDPAGYAIDSFVGNLFGFGKTKIRDQGIALIGGLITDMTEGAVAQAFADLKRKSLFGSSSKTVFEDLDEAFNDQLNLIFESMIDTVTAAGEALGIPLDEIQARIARFEVEAQEISLKDLNAEEQQAELEAVFSAIFDDLASSVIPFIDQFQQIGEGMGETLVRVATSVQVAQEAIHRLGLNISDSLGPERMAQVSVGLIEAAGGIEQFITDMENFMSKFAPEAHQFAIAQSDITRALEQMNMDLPESRQGFWELIQAIDGTTEAGQRQIATLLGLADAADTFYSAIEEVEKEREGLERRLMELNGETIALRELELEKLDESNRALQKRIWVLEIMSGVSDDIASLVMSSERLSFHRINQEFQEAYEQAQRLGASERELNLIRWRHTLQLRQMASELEASIVSMLEEFQGAGSSLESVGDMAASAASSMQGLADSIRNTIISIQGSDTGTLNPVGQRDFLQEQFDIAMAAGDFSQANQIASQLAQSIRRVGASGTDADERIEQLLADLAEMESQARQAEPPTAAQVSGIASSTSSIEQDAMRQIELASQMIDKIGLLAAISGEAPLEIAERLGVPMAELIGTMLDVEQFGIDQVAQLGSIADQLGIGLSDLGDLIGINIGTLDDSMSLLNSAVRDTIGDLPPEIAGPLLEALDLVERSGDTTELEELVNSLSPDLRDELAPFFDSIDPTNYMFEQLEEQKEIAHWTMAGAQASEAILGIIEQVRLNMQAQNDNLGIPSYQTGTSFVPRDGPAYLHRGEAVLTAQENRERSTSDDRATVAAIRDMQRDLAARMDRQEREMRRRNDLLDREERRRRTTI